MEFNAESWRSWAWAGGVLLVSVLLAVAGHAALYHVLWRVARRSRTIVDDMLVRFTCAPTRILFPLLAYTATLDSITPAFPEAQLLRHIGTVAVISVVAWTVVGVINAGRAIIEARYPIDVPDNLIARRVRTQVELLHRVAVSMVGIIALAAVLMSFPSVRQVGVSLFASAGVAGLVLGIAARPTLGNMIAGMQIALSQPIRIDDIVVVEKEFGWVEEINTTSVVLRLWDGRRMIVPLTYFIEQPFTNWTRSGSNLLTTVYLFADYRVDVEALRTELDRIVRATPLWDGRLVLLQVTDATEKAVQLRALLSATNAGNAWDLRCFVREHLVAFLREQPEALPVYRAELEDGARRNDRVPLP